MRFNQIKNHRGIIRLRSMWATAYAEEVLYPALRHDVGDMLAQVKSGCLTITDVMNGLRRDGWPAPRDGYAWQLGPTEDLITALERAGFQIDRRRRATYVLHGEGSKS